MYVNFIFFRNQANIPKKTVAKFLNISVYTYMGYESNRLIVPREIVIMFSKMFDIPEDAVYIDSFNESVDILSKLESYKNLDVIQLERKLLDNITGKKNSSFSYRKIASIKKDIISNINK